MFKFAVNCGQSYEFALSDRDKIVRHKSNRHTLEMVRKVA